MKASKTKFARTTAGIREALFEEWEALRSGDSNPARARSIAMMANTILQSVNTEIEYHKYVSGGSARGQQKAVALDSTVITLGVQ